MSETTLYKELPSRPGTPWGHADTEVTLNEERVVPETKHAPAMNKEPQAKIVERLVFYCRTTSASTAPRTPRRTCCP